MKVAVFFALLAVFCSAPVFASDKNEAYVTSVFFTPDEMAKIASPDEKPITAPGDIHLGAVFYYGPDHWTLWLDGIKWTPETQRPDIHIIKVNADRVWLSLSRQNARPLTIALKPQQTWRAATGKVVEGMR